MSTKIRIAALAALAMALTGPAFAAQKHPQPGTGPGTTVYMQPSPFIPDARTHPWVNEVFGPNGDRQLVRPY